MIGRVVVIVLKMAKEYLNSRFIQTVQIKY